MPKTVWGSWWNALPFAKGKGKGKGGKGDAGKGGSKGKSKGKGQYSAPPVNMMEEYYDYGCDWSDGASGNEGEWKQIGMLGRSKTKLTQIDPVTQAEKARGHDESSEKFNFKVLEDPDSAEEDEAEEISEQTLMKRASAKTPKAPRLKKTPSTRTRKKRRREIL